MNNLLKIYGLYLSYKHKISRRSGRMLATIFIKDFKDSDLPIGKIHSIHSKGFSLEDWTFCKVNDNNFREYISTAQYISLHPINGEYSKHIDDKLALKNLCLSTQMNKYLPEYYFKIDIKGNIENLAECPNNQNNATVESIIDLLKEKGTLAIKLLSGSLGEGFIKAEYFENQYILNGKSLTKNECIKYIGKLKNYLITEYLKPHKDVAAIFPYTTNTIRYLVGIENGNIIVIKKYIRFGTKSSNFVDNYAAGGVLCFIDDNGNFYKGNILSPSKNSNMEILCHPDTGSILEGKIPLWNNIETVTKEFCKTFPEFKFLGIDYVITSDNKIKILEINSLTSLDALQFNGSKFRGEVSQFFKNLLEKK